MIHIYTDGSCKGNPGPGGWCAIILKSENDATPLHILQGNEDHTTNNRMEMKAIIEALRFVDESQFQKEDVQLHSDSNLLVQTLNQGWKKKANKDLWAELDGLNAKLSVTYNWVKAHHTNKWNNECDKIALKQAEKAARTK